MENKITSEESVRLANKQILDLLLSKWEEEAKARKANPDDLPMWQSKMVSTEFTLNGIRYVIEPGDIGLDYNGWEDALMEVMQDGMESDLREAGATDIKSFGSID